MGLSFYTLGQRKGIGVGGSREGSGEAWFVARKDMASNTLWVVQGHDHPWLLSRRVRVEDASWVGGGAPQAPHAAAAFGAKTRYRQRDADCRLRLQGAAAFEVDFDAPQWAATPGQSTVLYDGEVCLGGGVILAADDSTAAEPLC